MPKKSFALEPSGPRRLEVWWKGMWKNTTVRLDGNVIRTVPGQKELKAGQTFSLPDGSQLEVKLTSRLGATELHVLRNGQPVPGSSSDPATTHKLAYGIIFFIAALNILLGILAVGLQIDLLKEMGIGIPSVIIGLAFLVLGVWVRRGSAVALIVAIAAFVLDGILGSALTASQGFTPNVSVLVVRFFLLLPLIQGIGAIRKIKAEIV